MHQPEPRSVGGDGQVGAGDPDAALERRAPRGHRVRQVELLEQPDRAGRRSRSCQRVDDRARPRSSTIRTISTRYWTSRRYTLIADSRIAERGRRRPDEQQRRTARSSSRRPERDVAGDAAPRPAGCTNWITKLNSAEPMTGEREHLARQVDLLDQPGVRDDRAGAAADDLAEQRPGGEPGEDVDREVGDRRAPRRGTGRSRRSR